MPDNESKRSCGTVTSFAYSESLQFGSRKVFPAPFCFVFLCLLILAVWGMFFFFPATDDSPGSLYPRCPFHALTGLHCAGCGSLRTMSCLAKGDIEAAWNKNKLTILCMPFMFWWFIAYGARCFKIRFPAVFIKPVFIWLLLAAIIMFTIVRNIPIYPLTLLAPH